MLDGLVVTLIVGGIGLATWIYTFRMQRRADRLTLNGRAATARVVGATAVPIGEETGTAVTLRISGPGVPEFETTHRSIRHVPAVGEQIPVVVDPADNVFMIVR